MKGYTFIGFLCLLFLQAGAQNTFDQNRLPLQHIKSGISQSSATQIKPNLSSIIWIGTPNGVNKYDGTDFQLFEKSIDGVTGLTDGYVEIMYEDTEGNLYIGTNQGLNIYDRKSNVIKPYPFKEQGRVIQSEYIGAIGRSDNLLWLGTDNGLYRYDMSSGEAKELEFEQIYREGPSNNYIVEVFTLANDRILVITQASFYILNKEMEVISESPKPLNISSAITVGDSVFWLGAHTGDLIRLKIKNQVSFDTLEVVTNPGHSILSLTLDNDGNVWAGSENDGLSIYMIEEEKVFRYKTDVRYPNSISSNSIWSLHKTRNGVIWMGPFKQGLSFYDPEYYKFRHIKTDPFNESSLSNDIVNCFYEEANGDIWIGTDGGGLNYWNRSNDSFEHFSLSNNSLNSNVVLTLYKDQQERLWVGTWANGLTFFDQATKKYTNWNKENSFLGSNNVIGIIQDKKERIWIATLFGGLHVYYPELDSYEHVRLKSKVDGSEVITPARLFEDKSGNIWVGTQTAGIFRLEEKDNTWTQIHYKSLEQENSISNDFINTITEDSQGRIWIGTQAGLNLYQEDTDSFKSISKAEGLKDDAIKGIIEDDEDFLWLSTSGGIIRYNLSTGESSNYDLDDGLQSNQFNASSFYQTKNGEFLFGGSNGFNAFTTDHAKKRKDAPSVYLSSLKIFNKPVFAGDEFGVLKDDISQTDAITFSYDHSVINFEFRALTYRHPDKINYAYFLEGFENDWNYVGNNPSATYTNLSPGSYMLRIKSTNSDGIWNDKETTLSILIEPPYWSTWWFRGLLVLSLGLIIYVIYLNRIRNIKKYQTQLEIRIDERTKELQIQKEKLLEVANELSDKNEEIQRFAFAVSHDLKSPLNSIMGIAGLVEHEVKSDDYPELNTYLDLIKKSCNTMRNLINDITKIARIGKIENKKERLKTNDIIQSASELVIGRLKERNVQLSVEENLPTIYGDENRMIQVFENLIDNAVKYMGDQQNPTVTIASLESKGYNHFVVKDNGSGMDENALKKLFAPFERFHNTIEGTGLGLYMIKQIVESHDGSITATSEGIDKGATFTVLLPKVLENG